MTEPLTPEDAAVLRMLAGANFLGGRLTLPSGRTLTPDEAQAFTSAYAPAAGQHTDNDEPPEARHAGRSPLDLYLSAGGDPYNERTMALMRESSRNRPWGTPPPEVHRDGIRWSDAPIPHRWHRCKPWTTSCTRNLDLIEHCSCGGRRGGGKGHPWLERNSRRKGG